MSTAERGQRPSMQDVEDTMQALQNTEDILRASPRELGKKLSEHHPVFASFVILTTPPGFAPQLIRREWIGIELPVRSETEEGVPIVAAEAIDQLKAARRDTAASWWYRYFEGHGHEIFWLRALINPLTMVRKDCLANMAHLVFERSCGEYILIDENN